MDVLLGKFGVLDIESLEIGTKNWTEEEIGNINFEKRFNALADKKSSLIKNIYRLEKILEKTKVFDEALNLENLKTISKESERIIFNDSNENVDMESITTPKEIEQILTDQITPEWLSLAFTILNERSPDLLIQQILKNIILEKCKKILILTIKTLKTKETQLQSIHRKLLPISDIAKIIYRYEPLQYEQFLELYKGCIHWYYSFYTSLYIQALANCKIETVVTVQEQATSYFSMLISSASSEYASSDSYEKYEDHDNFKLRLSRFQTTMEHVVPLQILESSNASFKIEDLLKNFALLLQDNYKKEMKFVRSFFNQNEKDKEIEVFDDRFLFVKCEEIFRSFIESIEVDYLGILIFIRLVQKYVNELEEDSDLHKFWQEILHLQLWPKFQKITSMRIYQVDVLKNCEILKFYNFLHNLLSVELALNQRFEWNSEPIYQSFINGLNLFEKSNKNLKHDKGKQHWRILMFNLLDEIDLELREKEVNLAKKNIISELRERYET
ncbi:hypothetical protein QEN19_004040 [Hanseniaspora menglaensis]